MKKKAVETNNGEGKVTTWAIHSAGANSIWLEIGAKTTEKTLYEMWLFAGDHKLEQIVLNSDFFNRWRTSTI